MSRPSDAARFFVNVSIPTFAFTVEDVWPDGGAPENPTDEDVARVMREYGPTWRLLHDWDLTMDATISVGAVDV